MVPDRERKRKRKKDSERQTEKKYWAKKMFRLFVMLHGTIVVLFTGLGVSQKRNGEGKLCTNQRAGCQVCFCQVFLTFLLNNKSIRKRPEKTEDMIESTC